MCIRDRYIRNPSGYVDIVPGVNLEFSGPISDLTMTWPRSGGKMKVFINLAWVESLLASCFTRDDAGDWQACVPSDSPENMRRIIEAGGPELAQSCHTCAARAIAGACPVLALRW